MEIKNLNKFMEWVEGLPDGKFVFRGVSNEKYEIEASTYRRLKNDEGGFNNETDKSAEKLLEINEEMIADANRHKHRWKNEQPLSDLNLLAELQHHGAATCLIDFTKNPLAALWMACRKSSRGDVNGKVYAVDVRSRDTYKPVGVTEAEKKPISFFFQRNRETGYPLYQWQPNYQNSRMLAQQSIFLFGGGWGSIKASEECIILKDNKEKIRRSLRELAGITGDILFPDFEGFADQRAENKPYYVEQDVVIDKDKGVHQTPEAETDEATVSEDASALALSYLNLGRQAFHDGEIDEAIRYFSYGIGFQPVGNVLNDLYQERAAVYYNKGDFNSATGDYNEVISLNRDDARAYYWRGRARYELGQYAQAMLDFDQAIALDSNSADFHFWQGMARFFANQYVQAIESFGAAILLNPNPPYTYYYWQGVARFFANQYVQAINSLDQAIVLDPNSANSYNWRGRAKYGIEEYFEAIDNFNQAILLNPDEANFYFWRGRSKKQVQMVDEAQKDLQIARILAVNTNNYDLIRNIDSELSSF